MAKKKDENEIHYVSEDMSLAGAMVNLTDKRVKPPRGYTFEFKRMPGMPLASIVLNKSQSAVEARKAELLLAEIENKTSLGKRLRPFDAKRDVPMKVRLTDVEKTLEWLVQQLTALGFTVNLEEESLKLPKGVKFPEVS